MNFDTLNRQGEHARRDLRHFRIDALPHFNRAGRDRHRAVGVNVDERARLIHRRFSERDAETNRLNRDAFFYKFIIAVKFVGFSLDFSEIERFVGLRPARFRFAFGDLPVWKNVAVLQ